MERKEMIIRAAMQLAAEHGLRAVSMQQIADQVGIRKASLYNHFSSKEELVQAMYIYLRENARRDPGIAYPDLETLLSSGSLKTVLMQTTSSYQQMGSSPEMFAFYKIIFSERALDSSAAEIMIAETQKMIHATTMLFYALQAKRLAEIPNIERAAFAFAMGVHSIINYRLDLEQTGITDQTHTLEQYIDEFCDRYGIKEEEPYENK